MNTVHKRMIATATALVLSTMAHGQSEELEAYETEEGAVFVQKITIEADQYFDPGSARLDSAAFAAMIPMVETIVNIDDPRLLIIGHSDYVEAEEADESLSYDRALAVGRYIQMQAALPGGVIAVAGAEDSTPVVDCTGKDGTELAECLAPNRRVEVIFPAVAVIENDDIDLVTEVKSGRTNLMDVVDLEGTVVTILAE